MNRQQQFQEVLREVFGSVWWGQKNKPRTHRPDPDIIQFKIMSYDTEVLGALLEKGTRAHLTATIKGYRIPALCGLINMTQEDFIGWCSLAQTVFDRSYEPPLEYGTSGIYRVWDDLHLRTRDGNLFLPAGRIVAILNSHLLCDLESSFISDGRVSIGDEPWVGAIDVPHPNHNPDYWHEVGYGHPRRVNNWNQPTLDILIQIGALEREYDGDCLMKTNIPEAWRIWDDEDEADII